MLLPLRLLGAAGVFPVVLNGDRTPDEALLTGVQLPVVL